MLLLARVAEAGSLTAAATRLHLTVSAVSQQVAALEREAGQALLERRARGVALTQAGEVIAAHAASVGRLVDAAEEELAALAGLRHGSLRLGTIPTVTESFLPEVISEFRAAHPAVSLSVQSAQISQLRGIFEAREVELAVMWERDGMPAGRAGELATTPLRDDPSVLLVPRGHPAAEAATARLEDFAQERWIIRSSQEVLGVLQDACRAAGFAPQASVEARAYQEVQSMVAIGMGVALVPTLSLATLRSDVVPLAITPVAPSRRIVLVQRRHDQLSPAARAMAEILLRTAASWQPAQPSADPVRRH
jgi:DNA-binding transcriptional LysR family regulator